MTTAAADDFALYHAINQAESVTRYLNDRKPEQIAASLESIVWAGVMLGETLPLTWRLAFDNLFRPGEPYWCTVGEFEAARNAVRRLFFTHREAMEAARQVAESLQAQTGRKAKGLDRLLEGIEKARRLEEDVFRDWPSFAEPLPPPDLTKSLPVEEAFAEIMGLTVEQVREKVAEHKRKYYGGGEPKP
jgi:hypothetical protein